jgi:hypothetical protein
MTVAFHSNSWWIYKAKWLCMCFSHSRDKTLFSLWKSRLKYSYCLWNTHTHTKNFNTGWQEMFWTIGTIGLITYAKALVQHCMCINRTVDVGGRLQPRVTNSIYVEESVERETKKVARRVERVEATTPIHLTLDWSCTRRTMFGALVQTDRPVQWTVTAFGARPMYVHEISPSADEGVVKNRNC